MPKKSCLKKNSIIVKFGKKENQIGEEIALSSLNIKLIITSSLQDKVINHEKLKILQMFTGKFLLKIGHDVKRAW